MTSTSTMIRKFMVMITVLTVSMVISLLFCQPGYTGNFPQHLNEALLDSSKPRAFLISTKSCRIPDVDPFDSSISHLIKTIPPLNCTFTPQVTYATGNVIYINFTVINATLNHTISYCMYQTMKRANNSDSKLIFGPWIPFTNHVHAKDRYIKVKCDENKNNTTFYTNFHSFVVPDNSTEDLLDRKLKEHIIKDNPKEILNVLMLGIDSTSRINFMRRMPKTRNYILKELAGIEMSGYTKVADNTFPNIVPMMSGKTPEELPYVWRRDRSKTFDEYNFIWKNFTSKGYRTFFAEDAPAMAIFQYLKKGFTKPPTYYYNRPLSYAMEKAKHLWSNKHFCFQGKLENNIVLDETREFVQFYRKKPHFAFTFLSRMTHDSIHHAAYADEPYFLFLQKLANGGFLNNSVLFVLSDHGSRTGRLRRTFIGKLEERLPLFYIVFPSWFMDKYPDLIKTVKNNGKRLTTPFDVYETLLNLVNFNGVPKSVNRKKRGLSLFTEIPEDRTCEDAGIVPHWCVCLETESLSVSSKHVQMAAKYVVSELNNMLKNSSDVCETLCVAKILSAVQMRPKGEALYFESGSAKNKTEFVVQIQLMLETKPGLGVFEATVRLDEKMESYRMVGAVSRINKYGDQSHCVMDLTLKLYCYCKDKLVSFLE